MYVASKMRSASLERTELKVDGNNFCRQAAANNERRAAFSLAFPAWTRSSQHDMSLEETDSPHAVLTEELLPRSTPRRELRTRASFEEYQRAADGAVKALAALYR